MNWNLRSHQSQCRRHKRLRFSPWLGKTPEKGTTTQPSVLAWRSPGTEETGGLQSMGSQRVRHDWGTNTFTFTFKAYLNSLVVLNLKTHLKFSLIFCVISGTFILSSSVNCWRWGWWGASLTKFCYLLSNFTLHRRITFK